MHWNRFITKAFIVLPWSIFGFNVFHVALLCFVLLIYFVITTLQIQNSFIWKRVKCCVSAKEDYLFHVKNRIRRKLLLPLHIAGTIWFNRMISRSLCFNPFFFFLNLFSQWKAIANIERTSIVQIFNRTTNRCAIVVLRIKTYLHRKTNKWFWTDFLCKLVCQWYLNSTSLRVTEFQIITLMNMNLYNKLVLLIKCSTIIIIKFP